MNKQVFNFCAGPAMLPPAVMVRAQTELLNWQQSGCSVMEVSHRSEDFIQVAQKAERDLRTLLSIPDDYAVLFSQGGGRGQFSAVPLNLSAPGQKAMHMVTGSWSKGAVEESLNYNDAVVVGRSVVEDGIVSVPKPDPSVMDSSAAYLHFCPNETVDGVAFDWLPDSAGTPLVADLSSTILSQPLDVSRYGVIYAGAQKNIGPSGLAVVIVRRDLLGKARRETPSIMNYQTLADNDSMYNTPPTFSWYLAGLVFEWLLEQGGVDAMAQRNRIKAATLYEAIDNSDFYRNSVHPDNRSRMNVPFQLADAALDKLFLAEAEAAGLVALKGHRSVGGMRASLYNAMPQEGVDALVHFMADFEKRKG